MPYVECLEVNLATAEARLGLSSVFLEPLLEDMRA